MSPIGCEELHDLAPELALGVLVGPSREAALEHLGGCVECRALVDELSGSADALLLLAPEAEPPLGFESRVVARMAGDRRRRRWTRLAVVGAAALILVVLVGVGVVAFGPTRAHRSETLPTLDPAPRSAGLENPAGTEVGYAVVVSYDEPWIAIWMNASPVDGTVACQLVLADGRALEVGSFTVTDGRGSWTGALGVDPGTVRSVRLTSADGAKLATATLA